MNEHEWISIFVARLARLRGPAADWEAIRLLALTVYPVYKDLDPLEAAGNEMRLAGKLTPGRKLILVADDYDDAAQLVANLVEVTSDFEAIAAKDGREALTLALRRRPDVALLDIDLPKIDGIETARAMLVACTGGRRADEASLSAQFDYVLTKPIPLKRLLSLIAAA